MMMMMIITHTNNNKIIYNIFQVTVLKPIKKNIEKDITPIVNHLPNKFGRKCTTSW